MKADDVMRPASVGALIALAAVEGVATELAERIAATVEITEPTIMRATTVALIVVVFGWAWTSAHRVDALTMATVLVGCVVVTRMGWLDPQTVWVLGASVLILYEMSCLMQAGPLATSSFSLRVPLAVILCLLGIPLSVTIANTAEFVSLPCNVAADAVKLRTAIGDPIGAHIAGRYVADSATLGCLDSDFGPHAHGTVSSIRFFGGHIGRGLLVYNGFGETATVSSSHRTTVLEHLASGQVRRLTSISRGDLQLYIFEREKECTVVYDRRHMVSVSDRRGGALLALMVHHGTPAEAYFEDPQPGSSTTALVVTFSEGEPEQTSYRLTLDAEGKVIGDATTGWLRDAAGCPGVDTLVGITDR